LPRPGNTQPEVEKKAEQQTKEGGNAIPEQGADAGGVQRGARTGNEGKGPPVGARDAEHQEPAGTKAGGKDEGGAARPADVIAEEKAKDDVRAALADLSDILLTKSGGKLNITPEQEQKLLPVLTRLFDAAFRLGHHKFKAAARYVRDEIRKALGAEVENLLTVEHYQGAYIGMAGKYRDKGADTAAAVAALDDKGLFSDEGFAGLLKKEGETFNEKQLAAAWRAASFPRPNEPYEITLAKLEAELAKQTESLKSGLADHKTTADSAKPGMAETIARRARLVTALIRWAKENRGQLERANGEHDRAKKEEIPSNVKTGGEQAAPAPKEAFKVPEELREPVTVQTDAGEVTGRLTDVFVSPKTYEEIYKTPGAIVGVWVTGAVEGGRSGIVMKGDLTRERVVDLVKAVAESMAAEKVKKSAKGKKPTAKDSTEQSGLFGEREAPTGARGQEVDEAKALIQERGWSSVAEILASMERAGVKGVDEAALRQAVKEKRAEMWPKEWGNKPASLDDQWKRSFPPERKGKDESAHRLQTLVRSTLERARFIVDHPELAEKKSLTSIEQAQLDGEEAFKAGAKRIVPKGFLSMPRGMAEAWYRGWDRANIDAFPDGWEAFKEDDDSYTLVGPDGEKVLGFHSRRDARMKALDLATPESGRAERIAQADIKNDIAKESRDLSAAANEAATSAQNARPTPTTRPATTRRGTFACMGSTSPSRTRRARGATATTRNRSPPSARWRQDAADRRAANASSCRVARVQGRRNSAIEAMQEASGVKAFVQPRAAGRSPDASTRVLDDGWHVKMPVHYGYIKRTEGADGEQVDVFIGPHPEVERAFIINQNDAKTGAFDEHKVMLGFDTREQAIDAYMGSFQSDVGGRMFDSMVGPMTIDELKEKLPSLIKAQDRPTRVRKGMRLRRPPRGVK
jgi:hypothetical protein